MLSDALSGMNYPWRSTVGDIPIRLMILRRTREIFETVQLPCDPDVLEETLNELVPKLEADLYRNATSLEEYGDPRTVKQRLESMAPQPGHIRPLEALWLQALLTTQSSTNGADHEQNLNLPFWNVGSYAESSNEDAFTRSLLDTRAFLDRYDAFANRTIVVDPHPEQQPSTISSRRPRPMDLRCRERMDDVMESF